MPGSPAIGFHKSLDTTFHNPFSVRTACCPQHELSFDNYIVVILLETLYNFYDIPWHFCDTYCNGFYTFI